MSRYYTLDEDTYLRFLYDDGEGGCLSLYVVYLVVFDLVFDYLFVYAKMDLFAFIHVADPTKVKIVEREHAEGERKLLDSIVRRVVLLLPVALARSESELEASVDKLFDEGGSTDQGCSAAGGGHNAEIESTADVEGISAENVTAERPKRQRKKRLAVTDVSGSSHHPKKLKGDHETSSGVATGGKSPSVVKELLASSIMNAEAGVTSVATLPFSISATPEREGGDPTDSVTGPNLRTVGPAERFFIFSDSSHHSSTNASGAEVDSIIMSVVLPPVMTEAVVTSHAVSVPSILVSETETKITYLIRPFVFQDSGSTETVRPDVAGPSYYAKQDLLMGSRELNTETLHQVFVSQWNVLNDSLLDDSDFNVKTARQACLNAEVRIRTEYCLSERKRLESECEKQADLLKARDGEIENLKAQLLLKEAEATEAVHLRI
ncbi:hypothetical protein Tco_1136439 [Tanacetum coccineum]